jgi:hypothetical protein
MKSVNLQDVIKANIHFDGAATTGGWHPVLCPICHDHGRKGPRAGFLFDGEGVGYHCFNCGHKARYNPSENHSVPAKMREVLEAFNIPSKEWQVIELTHLAGQPHTNAPKEKPISIEPEIINLPPRFYPLSEATDKLSTLAKLYLESRSINFDEYPFFLSKKTGDKYWDRWYGRLIIPIYKDSKLIFYIGRTLINDTRKYLNPPNNKTKVLYGFDKLFVNKETPLYIVEGWFDAYAINGVAILGNDITKEQRIWLDKSPRKKVYIPDRFGNGFLGAKKAIEFGWDISTPDIGEDCKDISEAVNKFGKLYVVQSINEKTYSSNNALIIARLYCKK